MMKLLCDCNEYWFLEVVAVFVGWSYGGQLDGFVLAKEEGLFANNAKRVETSLRANME